jgi:predicted MFS family arabinose efflux permease
MGTADRACLLLWVTALVVYLAVIIGTSWLSLAPLAIGGFIVLGVSNNLWRPLQVVRVQDESPAEQRASLLSIESQAKSIGTILMAPLVGWAVDGFGLASCGYLGIATALLALLFRPAPRSEPSR